MTTVLEMGAHQQTAVSFAVDPEIKDLDRKLKSRDSTKEQRFLRFALPLLFAGLGAWAFSVLTSPGASSNPAIAHDRPLYIYAIGFVGVAIVSALTYVGVNSQENRERNKARRLLRSSMRRSLRTARDVIPMVTKDHVEAGIRFDEAIANSGSWSGADASLVRRTLLCDLSREAAILSCITERGMKTASEVFAALEDISTHTNPLQDGWL